MNKSPLSISTVALSMGLALAFGARASAASANEIPQGAGVTVESINGDISSAIGPEHCTALEKPQSIEILTSPPSMRPMPSSIDLRSATQTTPEKTITVFSAAYADDYCQGVASPNSKLSSGKQSLIIDRTQPRPRYILTTTLQCSDGRSVTEKKFVIKCDLNF